MCNIYVIIWITSTFQDDDNEFDHFQDEEEFEGFDSDRVGSTAKSEDKEPPKITITKVIQFFLMTETRFNYSLIVIIKNICYSGTSAFSHKLG